MGYSYDSEFPFAAFITNLGKYNEGELVGEWVKFPTTPEKLQEVFEHIGIGSKDDFGNPYEEWFITDYDCYVDGLYKLLGKYENLDELNYLASKLDELSPSKYEHFQAAMEISDYANSLKDLINLTDNLDKYDVYPGIDDYDDLGRYYIDELGSMEVPEYLQNYIDYEAYGRDIDLSEISSFTDQGYVRDNQNDFVEYYDGDRENIPEEYRVMASPEEVEAGLSYQEQQGMDDAMLDEATDLAFDMDVLLRAAQPGYAETHPDFHGKQEETADCLINGDYALLKDQLSAIAKAQGEHSQAAGELLKRMAAFDERYIGVDDRMLTASMEVANELDLFFRDFNPEYAFMFPDETVQQIVLHEHLYKGDTSAIKTGLLNMGREMDLAEETAPLIERLTDYEKEFGINTYTVYQLKDTEELHPYRFEGSEYLETAGLSIERDNYEAVYAAPLTPGENLESIYTDLNIHRPDNFHGHSLSVSDVVVLQEYGKESAHFCDRFGYKEVPEFIENPQEEMKLEAVSQTQEENSRITFYAAECMEFTSMGEYHNNLTLQAAVIDLVRALPNLTVDDREDFLLMLTDPENYLKSTEVQVEDDYGMIDGIINNGERAKDKEPGLDKPSVLGQLSQAKKECAERKPPEIGKPGKDGPEL